MYCPPPFGSFFGLKSLSLIFPDFGTFRGFVFGDFFDADMILISLRSQIGALTSLVVKIKINGAALAWILITKENITMQKKAKRQIKVQELKPKKASQFLRIEPHPEDQKRGAYARVKLASLPSKKSVPRNKS